MFLRKTGSHAESLKLVLNGKLDVAIVDVVVLLWFQKESPDDFGKLELLSPVVGDFLYYPIWLSEKYVNRKQEFFDKLQAIAPETLKSMHIKTFKSIEMSDFDHNPPVVPE